MSRTRRRQSKFGMFLICVVMIVVVTASTARAFSLNEKSRELAVTEASLEQQLAAIQQESVYLRIAHNICRRRNTLRMRQRINLVSFIRMRL